MKSLTLLSVLMGGLLLNTNAFAITAQELGEALDYPEGDWAIESSENGLEVVTGGAHTGETYVSHGDDETSDIFYLNVDEESAFILRYHSQGQRANVSYRIGTNWYSLPDDYTTSIWNAHSHLLPKETEQIRWQIYYYYNTSIDSVSLESLEDYDFADSIDSTQDWSNQGWIGMEDEEGVDGDVAASSPGAKMAMNLSGPAELSFRHKGQTIQVILQVGTTSSRTIYSLSSSSWKEVVIPIGTFEGQLSIQASSSGTYIDDVQVASIEAVPLSTALDNTDLTFVSSGNQGGWYGVEDASAVGGSSIQTLASSSSYTNTEFLTFTVDGPAMVSFNWRSLGATSFVVQQVHQNGNSSYTSNIETISYNGNDAMEEWSQVSFYIGEGTRDLRISRTNYSYSGSNVAYFDNLQVSDVREANLSEALDNDDLVFRLMGDLEVSGQNAETWDGQDALFLETSSSGSSSGPAGALRTLIEGPGRLSFAWYQGGAGVSLRLGSAEHISIDWKNMASTQEEQWQEESILIPAGQVYVEWFITSTYSSQARNGFLDKVKFSPIQKLSLAEALDNSELEWFTGPERAVWWGQGQEAWDLEDAAAAGFVSGSGTVSWIETKVEGPGTVRFKWFKQSGAVYQFYLGEIVGDEIHWELIDDCESGTWTTASQDVPAGEYWMAWQVQGSTYSHYGSALTSIAGYLDDVEWTGASVIDPIFPTATKQDGNWMESEWYGWMQRQGVTWTWHTEHGWQMYMGQEASGIYAYDMNLEAWSWTSSAMYPWMYLFGDSAGWYRYYKGTVQPERWFWRGSDGADLKEEDM